MVGRGGKFKKLVISFIYVNTLQYGKRKSGFKSSL